jgi:hypothetical protein
MTKSAHIGDSVASSILQNTTAKNKIATSLQKSKNSEMGAFNVHQLYQDLYISDMKDEIDNA